MFWPTGLWLRATVVDMDHRYVPSRRFLKLTYHGLPDTFDIWTSRTARSIAPVGSRALFARHGFNRICARDYLSKWRSNMSKGALIDAKDTMGNWYKSSIIDVKKDEIKIHYQGRWRGLTGSTRFTILYTHVFRHLSAPCTAPCTAPPCTAPPVLLPVLLPLHTPKDGNPGGTFGCIETPTTSHPCAPKQGLGVRSRKETWWMPIPALETTILPGLRGWWWPWNRPGRVAAGVVVG